MGISVVVGCNDDHIEQPVVGGDSAAGDSDCAAYVGLATPAEIAQTPRANVEAEVLAIEATGAFVASTPVVDRVGAELALIRAAYPSLANIGVSPDSSSQILIRFDSAGFTSVLAGTYVHWDCPNALYGAAIQALFPGTRLLDFEPKKYDTLLLAQQYALLPNVESAFPNFAFGDGPDICLWIDAGVHYYVFDDASGDCPAGCSTHTYWGFSIDQFGQVSLLGTSSTQSAPWFATVGTCPSWL